MHLLTEQIANDIVMETSLRLQRNVNIMNTDGIIIATLDKNRIGTVHKGAVEVLATGKTLLIHSAESPNWEGTQPGVNLPIVFMDRIIGVIGVTGDPDKMHDVGELVKMTTELMIKQEFMDSQTEWKQRTKEMVIDQLLKEDPSVASLHQSLKLLGVTLTPPFTAVVVQIGERSIANRPLIQQVEKAIGKRSGVAGFINMNRLFVALYGVDERDIALKVRNIYDELKRLQVTFRLAYSLPFDQLNKFSSAYKDCNITLDVSDAGQDLVSFAQIEVKSLIYQIDKTVTERFSRRVLRKLDQSKAETLEVFFTNDLNIQKAADELFVHRNTLIYRLNKLTEETGYDPRKFKDALILQVALWVYKKETKNARTL